MVVQDPLLCDLPIQVTLEEVNSQIALEYGQAMTVRVCKTDGEVMPVVVVQNATVLDLKKAIQRYVQLRQEREGGVQHISWSYVWRTYHLMAAGEKLTEDQKKLRESRVRGLHSDFPSLSVTASGTGMRYLSSKSCDRSESPDRDACCAGGQARPQQDTMGHSLCPFPRGVWRSPYASWSWLDGQGEPRRRGRSHGAVGLALCTE
ncbi:U11/U12 small nuclear ribonucleoprotein 25 kDa protein isoform X1 [Phacochoerus africanus]|uniref:U11/U12 small nuclear ribonucleoprotein 25 kDa protein isoform X1 n=1 Tax=Phacochoerus africanus TaxID=41426 RepID=UPI001FD96C36|nr:U11/U12 small nuclear ribonucleoprotein 25 kDa protein isoform X1 [Phacochoerus africanus]